MTSLTDRVIDALVEEHSYLAALVPNLTDDQLAAPSGASEWTAADVLGHLGSGAEIALAGLRSAIEGRPAPQADFNQPVWDRWNAMSADEKRAGYVRHSAALVNAFEALDTQRREALGIDVSYLPVPLPLVSFAALRLNEGALHGWDVRVGLDPDAELLTGSAELLAELLGGPISFMLDYVPKPDLGAEPVVLGIAGSNLALSITDTIRIGTPAETATAVFTGSVSAAIRLIEGRLGPECTPPDVQVTGNVTLDQLRRTFPGF
jgi:uncharacterized protein (TIGR03083 family)